jgi:aldehyde:ferredoxin oxidoreductase
MAEVGERDHQLSLVRQCVTSTVILCIWLLWGWGWQILERSELEIRGWKVEEQTEFSKGKVVMQEDLKSPQ